MAPRIFYVAYNIAYYTNQSIQIFDPLITYYATIGHNWGWKILRLCKLNVVATIRSTLQQATKTLLMCRSRTLVENMSRVNKILLKIVQTFISRSHFVRRKSLCLYSNSVSSTGNSSSGGSSAGRGTRVTPMHIRIKFGQLGSGPTQFSSPHGFCLGPNEEIVVADTNNHRMQIFDKAGELKSEFGTQGKEEGQLWYPRKVAVMKSTGTYVICDRGNERSRMQLFTKNGEFIKKIAIRYGHSFMHQSNLLYYVSIRP